MRADRGLSSDANGSRRRRPKGALALRVRCARRPAAELLGEIDDFLHQARGDRREAVVMLEETGRLAGSASSFLKDLAGRLVDHPGIVTLRDPSGYAEAFVDLWDLRTEDREPS